MWKGSASTTPTLLTKKRALDYSWLSKRPREANMRPTETLGQSLHHSHLTPRTPSDQLNRPKGHIRTPFEARNALSAPRGPLSAPRARLSAQRRSLAVDRAALSAARGQLSVARGALFAARGQLAVNRSALFDTMWKGTPTIRKVFREICGRRALGRPIDSAAEPSRHSVMRRYGPVRQVQ